MAVLKILLQADTGFLHHLDFRGNLLQKWVKVCEKVIALMEERFVRVHVTDQRVQYDMTLLCL